MLGHRRMRVAQLRPRLLQRVARIRHQMGRGVTQIVDMGNGRDLRALARGARRRDARLGFVPDMILLPFCTLRDVQTWG